MKRVLPNSKIVNHEVNQSQINKNNEIDIEYNIKRIKKERRYTLILVIFFLVLMVSIFYFLLSRVQNKIENYKVTSGNLSIIYENDHNGIKDSVNIRKYNDKNNYYLTIFNNNNKTTKYIVYLVDEKELISLEGCSNNIIDYSKVKFIINNSEEKDLLSTKEKNNYILEESTLIKKTAKEIRLKIYYDSSVKENYHYHGRILVKEKK